MEKPFTRVLRVRVKRSDEVVKEVDVSNMSDAEVQRTIARLTDPRNAATYYIDDSQAHLKAEVA